MHLRTHFSKSRNRCKVRYYTCKPFRILFLYGDRELLLHVSSLEYDLEKILNRLSMHIISVNVERARDREEGLENFNFYIGGQVLPDPHQVCTYMPTGTPHVGS